jgi:hypothetical protein
MPISDQRKLYNKQYKSEYKERMTRATLTFTKSEYEKIQEKAKSENTKPATLLKDMAMAYYHQTPLIPEVVANELQELRFLIRNVANNINQIAHHSNTIQRLADENGLLLEIKKMEDTINEFVKTKLKNQQG